MEGIIDREMEYIKAQQKVDLRRAQHGVYGFVL